LQYIEEAISKAKHHFRIHKKYIPESVIWTILLSEGVEALHRRMRAIEEERNVVFYDPEQMEVFATQALFWWSVWKKTRKWLYIALAVTVFEVCFCFVCLPFVPGIARSYPLAATLSAMAVGAGIAAALIYTRLIHLLIIHGEVRPPAT
jgi:hypothetical protein